MIFLGDQTPAAHQHLPPLLSPPLSSSPSLPFPPLPSPSRPFPPLPCPLPRALSSIVHVVQREKPSDDQTRHSLSLVLSRTEAEARENPLTKSPRPQHTQNSGSLTQRHRFKKMQHVAPHQRMWPRLLCGMRGQQAEAAIGTKRTLLGCGRA